MSDSPIDSANDSDGDTSWTVQAHAVRNLFQAHAMEFRQAVRPEVALPYRAGTLPPRAAAFQHRETTDLLAQTLESGNAAVLTSDSVVRTGVVSGLGGVGKTQVAVDYAERVWVAGEVELMVWVTAGSREAIISTCARVAADVTGVQDADPQLGARRLMEWLASTSARWLIVLDDVQNPGDLRGLWPPATATGRVVVTTRRRDAALRGYGRRQIEVGVFTPHAAHDYLQAALADQPHLLDRAGELAGALGYLPLALAQAGAYMRDRNLPCAAYRDRLADRRRRLATLVPEPDGLPDEHQATVAATWSLSIEQANRLEPEGVAGLLLEVASMLDANGIPADVFMTPAVTDLLTSTLGRDVDAEQARDGLGCLHRLSLINLDPGSIARAVRIHALVQRVVRDTLPSRRLPIVVHAAADALLQIWPYVERDTALGQVLRANADALSEAGGQHLWEPDGHKVLFRAGNSLGQTGLVAEARDYFDRQRITAQKHHGSDHPDTLITRRHIAYWRGKAGDPAGAVAALKEVLADQLRVLGADHPDTLITRGNIARWRGEAGDPAGAVAALKEVLADQLRVLGADHPDTLITRRNIARWRGSTSDPADTAAAFEEVLADQLRVLGANHPDTLITRGNIAAWRGHTGDPAGAVAAFEEVLADRLRVLGADHPDTLITRGNIAHWRGEAGDPAGAVAALKEVLVDHLRVFSADHPHTLVVRREIAYWRGKAGDPAGAAVAFEEVLADQVRVLGANHPYTLITRGDTAYWRGEAGDPAGAVAVLKEVLADQLRVLGADHPDTLATRRHIAYWKEHLPDGVSSC